MLHPTSNDIATFAPVVPVHHYSLLVFVRFSQMAVKCLHGILSRHPPLKIMLLSIVSGMPGAVPRAIS